jgi:hypothetical protein
MGKITKVMKSRKQYTCGRCRKKIEVGQPYLRGDLNFSPPVIRCCECRLEYWEVTTSDYQLSVGELVYHWPENYDVSEEGRDGIVGELESIRDDLQDRLDNMPEGLQQGDTGQLLQDRIDQLDAAISDLENIDFDDFEEGDEDNEIDYRVEIESALENIEI